MAKKSPIFFGALLLTGVNLLMRTVSTGFQVFLSGQLGAAGIGLVQLVLSVGGMAMTAASAGIRTTAMYLTAGELGRSRPENIRHVLSCCIRYSIFCSLLLAAALYFSAPLLAKSWIGNAQTAPAIRLLACFLPVGCLCGVMTGYFTAAGRIGTLSAVEVSEQLFSICVTTATLLLWAKQDPEKACLAVVLGSGAASCLCLTLLTALRIRERAKAAPPFPLWRTLLDTAVPLALADDLKAGINTAESLMVPNRLRRYPHTADPLGTFGTVCGMVFPVLMFPASIVFSLAELLLPEIAQCHAAQRQKRIAYLARRALRTVLLYSSLICGCMYLLSLPLCRLLYGSTEAGEHLRLYALLIPMLYCDAITDSINKGLGQQKICVRINILTAALDVLFLYFLLPRYGMKGYFCSFFVTHLLNFCLSLGLFLHTARLRISMKTVFGTAGCGFFALILCRLLKPLPAVIGYLLFFPSLLTLTGTLDQEDLSWIKALFPRPSGEKKLRCHRKSR